MENFNNKSAETPIIEDITGLLVINYAITSISIDNQGDFDGTVNGKPLRAGRQMNFAGAYKANTFSLNATGTIFTITINK